MSSSLTRCPDCHVLMFGGNHTCKPKWTAVIKDYNDDTCPINIRARDAEEAAEEAASLYNEDGEYPMMDGDSMIEVTVTGPDGEGGRFEVNAEASITYHAREF